jgi:hypothetical protein
MCTSSAGPSYSLGSYCSTCGLFIQSGAIHNCLPSNVMPNNYKPMVFNAPVNKEDIRKIVREELRNLLRDMAKIAPVLVLASLTALTSGCLRATQHAPVPRSSLYAMPATTRVELTKPCRLDATGKRTAEPCSFRLIIDTVGILPATEGK